MIGVKPLFAGRSLGEGETASFDVVLAAPDGNTLAATGLRYELLKIESRYQWYRRDGRWEYEPIKLTRRVADGLRLAPGAEGQPVEALQAMLALYGYDTAIDGRYDGKTEAVVRAFQRHFRPQRIDGVADASTVTTLRDLIASRPTSAVA